MFEASGDHSGRAATESQSCDAEAEDDEADISVDRDEGDDDLSEHSSDLSSPGASTQFTVGGTSLAAFGMRKLATLSAAAAAHEPIPAESAVRVGFVQGMLRAKPLGDGDARGGPSAPPASSGMHGSVRGGVDMGRALPGPRGGAHLLEARPLPSRRPARTDSAPPPPSSSPAPGAAAASDRRLPVPDAEASLPGAGMQSNRLRVSRSFSDGSAAMLRVSAASARGPVASLQPRMAPGCLLGSSAVRQHASAAGAAVMPAPRASRGAAALDAGQVLVAGERAVLGGALLSMAAASGNGLAAARAVGGEGVLVEVGGGEGGWEGGAGPRGGGPAADDQSSTRPTALPAGLQAALLHRQAAMEEEDDERRRRRRRRQLQRQPQASTPGRASGVAVRVGGPYSSAGGKGRGEQAAGGGGLAPKAARAEEDPESKVGLNPVGPDALGDAAAVGSPQEANVACVAAVPQRLGYGGTGSCLRWLSLWLLSAAAAVLLAGVALPAALSGSRESSTGTDVGAESADTGGKGGGWLLGSVAVVGAAWVFCYIFVHWPGEDGGEGEAAGSEDAATPGNQKEAGVPRNAKTGGSVQTGAVRHNDGLRGIATVANPLAACR